jgi:hypothetical protein
MDRIDEALGVLDSQETPLYTEVAKQFGLVPSTLRRRHQGKTVSRATAASIYKRKLTNAQETEILQWISRLTNQGLPPTPQILENIVVELGSRIRPATRE